MSNILLSKQFIKSTCKLALNEDLYPSGDITSDLINNNINKKVKMISNQSGIIGGLAFAKETFKLIDKKIKFKSMSNQLASISPDNVLKRGYSIAINKKSNKIIRSVNDLSSDDNFLLNHFEIIL